MPVAAPEPLPPQAPPRERGERRRDVTLTVFLVVLLASTVMSWPLRAAGAGWVVAALRALTLVVGVAAIAPDRGLAIGAGIAAIAVAYGQLTSGPVELDSRLVFFGVVAAALLVRVFGPGRVTVHRVLGSVSVYVLLAVTWGTAYQLLLLLTADALRGAAGGASLEEAMWMSFVTITTTGYGDVLPASPLARSLATLEAIVGVLYPAVLIARLVSLLQEPPRAGGGRA